MTQPVEDTEAAPPVTVPGLCARYAVDMDHARQVASHALALFDSLSEVHGLPLPRRALLESAALLHDLGASVDPEHHHTAGRDLLLRESVEGFTPAERDVLACLVRFHRKKVRPEEEPVFAALPDDLKRETLALAALLRIGDALDASRTQSCRILSAGTGKGEAHLIVEGPHADLDSERAAKKADLWNDLFPCPLRVWNAGGSGLSPAPSEPPTPPSRREVPEEEHRISDTFDATKEAGSEESPTAPVKEDETAMELTTEEISETEAPAVGEDEDSLEEASLEPEASPPVAETASDSDPDDPGIRVELVEAEPVLQGYSNGNGSYPPPSPSRDETETRGVLTPSEIDALKAVWSGGESPEVSVPTAPEESAPGTSLSEVMANAYEDVLAEHARPAAPVAAPRESIPAPEEGSHPTVEEASGTGPGISLDEPVSAAAVKLLRFDLRRLLTEESHYLAGEDADSLGEYLNAALRLRTDLHFYGPLLAGTETPPPETGLHALLDRLRPVRDLTALLDRAGKNADGFEPADLNSLDPLLTAWKRQYAAFREHLHEFLGGPAHAEYRHDLGEFLDRARAADARERASEVRFKAPGLLWEAYGKVRGESPESPAPAPEASLPDGALRQLRSLLELLWGPLGRPVETPLTTLLALQNHREEARHLALAVRMMRQYLASWWRHAAESGAPSEGARGVTEYLLRCERELERKNEQVARLRESVANEAFTFGLYRITTQLLMG